MSAEPDNVVKLIVVERFVKSAVLALFATSLLTVGRQGYLQTWAVQAQEQLNLGAGHGLIARLLQSVFGYFARLPHLTCWRWLPSSTPPWKRPRASGWLCAGGGPTT